MSNHIFFKDKSAALKGPYTERQIQERYREKWFDGSFPFYFKQGDERPSGSESGWRTLNSLRSRNGIGCPFADYDEREKQEFEKTQEEGEKKMDKIEEDVADLQQKFAAILGLEEVIDRVEEDLEFFCCVPCDVVLFNYKQTLIHFTSSEHCSKETSAVRNSGIGEFRRILDAFTKLPAELAEKDAKTEQDRRKKYGIIDRTKHQGYFELRPNDAFTTDLLMRYVKRLCTGGPGSNPAESLLNATTVVMANVKGDLGRNIMNELNEHIGKAQTWCTFCDCKTGDREGFYAHYISSAHLKTR